MALTGRWALLTVALALSCSGPERRVCREIDAVVRRITASELGYEDLRAAGRCTAVHDHAENPTRWLVDYAYSSPDSRARGEEPVPYRAEVAHDPRADEFFVCRVTYFPGQRREQVHRYARHSLCSDR